MRYKCTVAYKGNNYVGFQSQINGIAIQDVIEAKLKIILGQDTRITMASRTDAKVHALGQVFTFDSDKVFDVYRLKGSMNGLLPKDIHINDIEIVDDDFHPRFMAKGKHYRYIINIGEYSPFLDGFAYQCYFKIDLEKMLECGKLFIGKHDFSAFNTTPYEVTKDQIRTIKSLDIVRHDDLLYIDIIGDGFLRHMVRMIVGTLIDVARGIKDIEDVKRMIDDHTKDDTRRYNIDACGLYLVEIYY